MKTLDARGYSCPMPVVMVQKEVAKASPAALAVLVDDKCAVENITRFGESRGYVVTWERQDGDFRLLLEKKG